MFLYWIVKVFPINAAARVIGIKGVNVGGIDIRRPVTIFVAGFLLALFWSYVFAQGWQVGKELALGDNETVTQPSRQD